MLLGVDVGGTFTDLVWWNGVGLASAKVPTTSDPSEGVLAGAARVEGAVESFVHGTTVATNALLERKGARTALVTTAGYADVLEIGRQDRPSLYDPMAERPTPLVVPEDRFEVAERLGPGGIVEAPATGLDELADRVAGVEPASIAVALLHSFARSDHERAVARSLEPLGVPISLSSDVAPEFREFERTSTTVLNAYLVPVVRDYLRRLGRTAREGGLPASVRIMRSSGGIMVTDRAAELPAAILLSGPAGGAVAAAALGRALGYDRVISFDMGGTSTDVCRIEGGRPEVSYERAVAGYPCRLPAVAIHTVGAGGGSIAWADEGGALRAGPHSAGADPGPACYRRGGEAPTITDANLWLGRIDPKGLLAGTLAIDAQAARESLARLGATLELDVDHTALGAIEVIEAHMVRAIRAVSLEEGADPRSATLVAFGGAGGLHATALARSLDMAGVVVPAYAGVFSALGLLLSPPRDDSARTVLLGVHRADALEGALQAVSASAAGKLRAGTGRDPERVHTFVDMRYVGQSHETVVPYRAGEGWSELEERFHLLHLEQNGFSRPGDPVEAVTVRAEALQTPELDFADLPAPRPEGEAARGTRRVLTSRGPVDAGVWWRPGLVPGDEVVGPAVIEEANATTLIGPGERAAVDPSGTLVVEW